APVVYGGKVRAIIAYMKPKDMQARDLGPLDIMTALDNFNIFVPAGSARVGDKEYALDSNSMYEQVHNMGEIPVKSERGSTVFLKEVAEPKDSSLIQSNVVRVDGRRQVYIPIYRQQGSSTLE